MAKAKAAQEDDELDEHIPLPDDICHPDIPSKRNTMEFRDNDKLLLEMCKSVSARILNGRLVVVGLPDSLFIKM